MASTVWKGFVTFGLISIPVRLFRAARAERVSLRRLYRAEPSERGERKGVEIEEPAPETRSAHRPALAPVVMRSPEPRETLIPVRQASIPQGAEDAAAEKSIVKGYEYEKGRFVAVEAEELKEIRTKTGTEIEIEEFVNLAEIDPVYFETSYYVTPEDAGTKAYALLYRALQETNLVALAQVAMHGREHVVVLRPGKTGIVAHTMFYSSEVRADEEYRADTSGVTGKELKLAETLIHSLAAPFDPTKYRDKYRERLESMLARKAEGQPVRRAEVRQTPADVVDITEALRKSLANLKKPATSDRTVRTALAERPGRTKKGGQARATNE